MVKITFQLLFQKVSAVSKESVKFIYLIKIIIIIILLFSKDTLN